MRRILIAVLFGALAAPTAAFAQSAQSQAVVSEWYNRFLHRPFEPAGLGWALTLDQGQSPDKILSGILGSDEYYGRSGGTPQGYVQTLFTDVNGRAPSPAEYAFWLNRLVQIGGAAPGFPERVDEAYAMLVRYPQNWIAPAPVVVAPQVPVVVAPRVIEPRVVIPPVIDYDRRFHDHDEHFEYRRPVLAPVHHDFEHRDGHDRRDEHDRKR